MDNKHLIQLLGTENRIILPDFGAFIVQKTKDGGKVVIFNEYLKFNDGLIVNFLMKADNVDKDTATKSLSNFVVKVKERIEAEKPYIVEGVGVLFKDPKGKIQFDPYSKSGETASEQVDKKEVEEVKKDKEKPKTEEKKVTTIKEEKQEDTKAPPPIKEDKKPVEKTDQKTDEDKKEPAKEVKADKKTEEKEKKETIIDKPEDKKPEKKTEPVAKTEQKPEAKEEDKTKSKKAETVPPSPPPVAKEKAEVKKEEKAPAVSDKKPEETKEIPDKDKVEKIKEEETVSEKKDDKKTPEEDTAPMASIESIDPDLLALEKDPISDDFNDLEVDGEENNDLPNKEVNIEDELFSEPEQKAKRKVPVFLWIIIGIGVPIIAFAVFAVFNLNMVMGWIGMGTDDILADNHDLIEEMITEVDDGLGEATEAEESIAMMDSTASDSSAIDTNATDTDTTGIASTEVEEIVAEATEETSDSETSEETVSETHETTEVAEETVEETVDEPEEVVEEVAEEKAVTPTPSGSGPYHVVVGCFQSTKMAENYISSLNGQGVNEAHIWGKIGRFNAIVVGSYSTMQEANTKLNEYNNKISSPGWVYKK